MPRFSNPFHGRRSSQWSVTTANTQSTGRAGTGAFTDTPVGSSTAATSVYSIPPPTIPSYPGDEQVALPLGLKVTPLQIRELGDLIRKRYALDIEIWGHRFCKPRDYDEVEDLMRRADAALQKILNIIRAWDDPQAWKLRADWQRLRQIRERLEMDGKRMWSGNPPWANEER